MKNWLKGCLCAAGMIGCLSLGLVGCTTQTDIKNSSTDIVYNGGVVSVVDEHIIFSNGYASNEITTMDEYNAAANTSYLASIKTDGLNGDLYSSPTSLKIKGEVTGFENMYSFVYGNSIYYAIPNKHKTSSNEHIFTYVSFFKCGFDGEGEKELLITKSYDSATAQVRALKHGEDAYLFVYDGTELNCIDLESQSVKTISSAATSVALPNEGEAWDGCVYYTESSQSSTQGNLTFKYSLDEKQSTQLSVPLSCTVKFCGRSQDQLFYTLTTPASTNTRTATAKEVQSTSLNSAGSIFYSAEISDIMPVGGQNLQSGYIFKSANLGSEKIMYMQSSGATPSVLLANGEYTDVLLAFGDYVYYSTDASISFKTISTGEVTTLVEDLTIQSDKIGYDYYDSGNLKNIYFFAQREYAEDDETAEEDRDTAYYLYTVSATGGDVSLVGQVTNPQNDQPNLALIISLSVVGGVLLLGIIIGAVVAIRRRRGY